MKRLRDGADTTSGGSESQRADGGSGAGVASAPTPSEAFSQAVAAATLSPKARTYKQVKAISKVMICCLAFYVRKLERSHPIKAHRLSTKEMVLDDMQCAFNLSMMLYF